MQAAFAALGDVGKDLRMFFVSVDPERDTAQYLADYLTNFDPRIEGLVPTVAELPGIAKAFRVFYQKVPTSDGSYTMDHTATVFLFDRAGKFAGTIAFDEDPKLRVAKLKRLVEK
jgi:protein SCO1/2